jgi:hypothetical protein
MSLIGTDDFWEDLLDFIEQGKIIPIIGEHAVSFGDGNEPLYPWLARELANRLGLNGARLASTPTLNDVAREHLLAGGNRRLWRRSRHRQWQPNRSARRIHHRCGRTRALLRLGSRLSVVRKSRNSSSGLHRCRRRSTHDRRRTNAVRFLMNTLLAHPRPSLIHAFPAKNSLVTLGSHRCLRVPGKPLSRDPRLPAWHNYSSQSFGGSSILLFKAPGCWHAKNRYAYKIAPCLVCASSRTVLFPDAEQRQG